MCTRTRIGGLLFAVLLLFASLPADGALDTPHDTSTGTGCLSCHQINSTYPKLLPPLNHTPLPGDIDDTTSNGLCWSCHNSTIPLYVKTHSSLTTSSKYGDWTVECWVCHSQHSQEQNNLNNTTYGKFIRGSVNLAHIKDGVGNTLAGKAGARTVKFIANTGANSFADGDPDKIDGICEICHTDTTAWHNDGTLAGSTAHTGLKGSDCTRCHPHTEGFRAVYQCVDCHQDAINDRAAVGQQFAGTSHHIQGVALTSDKCYQCHWEADNAGKLTTHHSATPGAPVDLVIYGAGARPETYVAGATALAYTANGTRAQILSLNNHCLSCHNDQNNSTQPFGDGKTPKQYAWDGNSVDARYSRPETTTWGKYSPYVYKNVENKYEQVKALSAHGNTSGNQRGWTISAWESKTAIPDTIYNGADLIYPGTGDSIYATRGNGTTTFYHYSISGDTWATLAPAPNTISYGADLASAGDYIYALRGSSTQNFYRYSISTNSWATMTPVPDTIQWGGALVYPGSGDYIYALRGSYSTTFYRYSISTNSWSTVTPAPDTIGFGSDLVYPGTGNYLYATRGFYTATFYRYSISTNSWSTMTNAPAGFSYGGALASPGAGDYIYGVPGGGQTGFFRYSISANDWVILSSTPQSFNNGGSLAYPGSGNFIYALPGNGSTSFISYKIGDIWPNTSGTAQVGCFDCHNSHGSTAGDASNPATSYTSATPSGGILKDTTQNKGGYTVSYTPASGGTVGEKNEHNPGAGLCFDCHLTADGSGADMPWGFQATFGASQPIVGYRDTAGFGNGTFGYQQKYQYKIGPTMGGHFGASSALTAPGAVSPINGLCTPCHDPHGVSPSLGTDAPYAVPLLKGTFMTSPYKEDAAPASATVWFGGSGDGGNYGYGYGGASYPGYNIDQNTFANWNWGSTAKISEGVDRFGGLCLQCHPQSVLNPNAGGSNYPWRSMNRVHNTVKGWGGQGLNAGNAKHAFTCSKCHTAHNSMLPRLMITNCLDYSHRGRVGSGGFPGSGGGGDSGSDGGGGGSGRFPSGGSGSGSGGNGGGGGWSGFGAIIACHDGTNANGWPSNQRWNDVTPWQAPNLTSPTATAITSTSATLGANLTHNGGSAITARGTVWGTSANPIGNALAAGGTATGVFSHARTGLPAGTKIYYSGYAINSTSTAYSPDGSFYTEPATQASGVNFAFVTPAEMTLNWTPGDGDGVIVLMKQGSAVNSNPADGSYSSYAANASFGSGSQIGTGNYVVYKGSATSVTVTGLTSGTTYSIAVYAYAGVVNTSGVNQGTNYKLSPAIGSQITSAGVPVLTAPTATAIGSTTATLGANITFNGGAAITERGTAWGTSANPTGNGLAEGGTATGVFTQARTGLTAGTKIYYRGYATNSAGTNYSPAGSFYTEPSSQTSGVSFSSVGISGLTVNWTRGSGDGVIVLMKQGSAVNSAPADGTYTGYTANAVFGSGTPIGAGNYVVYKGIGSSVTISGLTGGTTYYLAIHEYKGAVDTSGVNQGTNYKSSPATNSQTTNAGSTYSQTFNYTGSLQTLNIPAGASNIQFTVKGAGGGGGRADNIDNQEAGLNGHSVIMPYATSNVTLSIYVGGGGSEGSVTDFGAAGGWGNPSGANGGDGDYYDSDCWAYGGSGGGGASAIYNGAALLARAAGGNGGRSSDWEDYDYCYTDGGVGGAGGGADYPATTSPTGGGSGGSAGSSPSAGGHGQVVISYDL
jgi:hypothetical protein